VDPTVQISHMLAANDYTAAFNHALTLSDVNIVTWLLHQVCVVVGGGWRRVEVFKAFVGVSWLLAAAAQGL
jgi:hypothetical protein